MEFTLRDIVSIIARRWLIILLAALIGTGVGFAYTQVFVKDKYVARLTLYVNNYNAVNSSVTPNDLTTAQKLVNTYIVVLTSQTFLDQVVADSKVKYSATDVKSMLKMSAVNETEIFAIEVTNTTRTDAVAIADSISKLAQNEIVRVVEAGSVKIVDKPSSYNATSPTLPIQNSFIGFVFGFLIATVISLLIEVLDFRIKNEDDIENRYNIPLLGSVPTIRFEQ
ncbi:MAG: hypothetical protein BGN88_11995 [Clostridiales bacterium 43-6]|nr:MAG: hypothetical protein BGN88_11995 [Clostridiales bacterium 43-6]